MIPYLVWEAHYDWPTIEFLRTLQSHTDSISNPVLYLPYQLVLLGPVLTIIWIPGLIWLLRSEQARRFRALGAGYLVVLVLVFLLRGKAYYVGSWYPALFAAGSVRLERVGRRSLRTYVLILVASFVMAAPFALPLVPSSSILTSNYSEAGAIEYWHSSLGLPQPISRQNSYWIWGYGPAHENGTVVAVGFTKEELSRFFSDVQLAATITNAVGIHNKEFGTGVFICRAQRIPWAQIWPQIKDFS